MRLPVLILLACMAACAPLTEYDGIDPERALAHAQALVALGPHPGDSPQAQAAARYLEQQLDAMGVKYERMAVGAVTLPAIDVLGTHWRSERTWTTTDPNYIVRLGPTTGKALLIMAHYDTVKTSPGGVDNSAAVGVVLELARVLAAHPPEIAVMLVFTANEEPGHIGAEALYNQYGGQVGFAIALDLIGGAGDLSLNGASRLIGRAEMAWLADAADRAGVRVRAPLPHRVVSRAWPLAERSDHGAFTRHGIAAFHFYHRGQDGEWIDLAYHSMRDTAARIDRHSLGEIGRLLRALTAQPLPVHGGDGFWLPIAANKVIPRWLAIAVELVLAALALGLLVALVGARARGGLGLLAGLGCYAVATAVTIAIERLAAGDHPAPWLHAPGASALAELAIFVGALGLATRAAQRFAPWVGDRRYLAVAIAVPLALGLVVLGLGAAELAWIFLVPAAAAALAPRVDQLGQLGRLGRLGIVAIAVGLLPGLLVLAPPQLREAAWNRFWPIGVPLAAWIAGFAAAPLAGLAWWLRRSPAGPLGTLLLLVGSGLAITVGVILLLHTHPACTGGQFHSLHLACEVASEVR
jgi:hypothetical protein